METAQLALDLGTITGFAYAPTTGAIISGIWKLKPKRGVPEGERFRELRAHLDRLHKTIQITTISYEHVRRHLGTQAAHVYGGVLAVLRVWALDNCVDLQPLEVGQIKKFWTGRGNATKGQMIAEARARGFHPADDNEADALAMLHMALLGVLGGGDCDSPGGRRPKPAGAVRGNLRAGAQLHARAAGGNVRGQPRLGDGDSGA